MTDPNQLLAQLPYLSTPQAIALLTGATSPVGARVQNYNAMPGNMKPEGFSTPFPAAYDGMKDMYPSLQGGEDVAHGAGINEMNAFGHSLQTPNPDSLGITNHLRAAAGGAIALPGDAMHAVGNALAPTLNAVGDQFTKTQAEMDAEQQQKVADALAKNAANFGDPMAAEKDLTGAFAPVLGQGADGKQGPGTSLDLGPAQTSFGDYNIPAPPGPTDFSGVQAAIDQTKPTPVDPAEMDSRKKGAVLVGLMGGLLQGTLSPNADYRTILGGLAAGVSTGLDVAGADKKQAEDDFKKATDEYWVRTAGIRQNQAESNEQYADRVWQTKVQQLQVNAAAAERRSAAGESKLIHDDKQFYVQEVVNGRQTLKPLDVGAVNHIGNMEQTLVKVLGGGDEAKKKAGAIVAEVANRKDPTYGLSMLTVSRLKTNGKYLDLVNSLGKADPNFLKAFNSVGEQQQGASNLDSKSMEELASNRRDAMLMELITTNKDIRRAALGMAGITGQNAPGGN